MARRILLAGGGTAGHIEPALAVAEAIARIDKGVTIEFIGTSAGLESLLVPQRGYTLRTIPKVTLPRKISIRTLFFPVAIFRSVLAARRIIKGADLLIGFGGYVSASSYLAAKSCGVRIALHEANAKPGWANRLGRHFAEVVAVNFEQVRRDWPGSVLTGMPIRSAITQLAGLNKDEREKFRELHCKSWGFNPNLPLVAVFGGSQGSMVINAAISDYLSKSNGGIQIIHAVGINNPLPVARANYLPMPYFHDMAAIYGAADLLITRSGAVTCSELMTSGRFAVLVPLPHGNGEQVDNARALNEDGRAIMVDNEDFTGEWLMENLAEIVSSISHREISASDLHRGAAERIAGLAIDSMESKDSGSGEAR